jgi:hypothetical protein
MRRAHFILVSTCFALLVLSGYTNKKPKILIIGDSISLGFTPFVREIRRTG